MLRGPSPEDERSSAPPNVPAGARWRRAAALGLAVVLGLAAGYLARPDSSAPRAERWLLALPEGLSLNPVSQPALALSRDGRLQVTSVVDANGTAQLLLRDSHELLPRFLTDTEGATSPFFSPDGQWIGFFRRDGLYKAPLAGGPPVRLATTTAQNRGGTWGRDGFVYFVPDTVVGLSRVPEGGGAVETVTRLDTSRDERTHRWPQALDDGSVLFTSDTAVSTEYYDDARVEAVRPATGERRVVVENTSMARHAGSGPLVFARGGSLFAAAFDVRRLSVGGSPVKVLEGVATDVSSGAAQYALSASGALLWASGRSQGHFELAWVNRKGAATRSGIAPGAYNELAVSPDGTRLALVGGEGGTADLWVADLERGVVSRLTTGQTVQKPVFSPDGSRIAYGTRPHGARGNAWEVVWKPVDGSRPAETLVEGQRNRVPSAFTPDGRHLVYDAYQSTGLGRDVLLLPLDPPREPRTLVSGPFASFHANVSPDGRGLAYVSDESGQLIVYVRPFPDGEGRYQVSPAFGTEPRFSRDGRELFYRSGNAIYAVAIEPGPTFKAGRPQLLFDRVATGALVSAYAPSPDGRRFFTFRDPDGGGGGTSLALDLGFQHRLDLTNPASR